MSQEGFPSSGVRRIRDVEATAQQYRIGGGTGSINDPRIIDVIFAESGIQEVSLSDYTPVTTGSVDDLGPDDFGTLPLINLQ
jgi:hypothetical protein